LDKSLENKDIDIFEVKMSLTIRGKKEEIDILGLNLVIGEGDERKVDPFLTKNSIERG